MNNLKTAALAASMLALSFLTMRGDASSVKFSKFRISPEFVIPDPAIPSDSMAAATNNFSEDILLKSAYNMRTDGQADWQLVDMESLTFPSDGAKTTLATLATRLRPSSFVKGKFRLKTNVISELRAGKDVLLKVSSPDSVANWHEATISIEPERTVDLALTILSSPDSSPAELQLEFVPDKGFENVTFAEGPDVKKRFLIENTALGTRLYRTEISPDGKYMILSYYTMYGQKSSRYWSELRETATGKTLNASLPSRSFWMKEGSAIGYTVKTDETWSLYSMDAATQKTTLLAENLPDDNFTMSPDGNYLIMSEKIDGDSDKGPLLRLRDPDDRLDGHRDRFYLKKYDLKSGIVTPVTYSGNSTYLLDISPDSKRILYMSTTELPDTYPFYFMDIVEMDIASLHTDTLVRKDPFVKTAIYSPEGKQLFLTGGPESFDATGKNNPGSKYGNDYDCQGFIMDIASKSIRPVTIDFNPSLEGEGIWNHADGNIYFRATDGFDLNVYRLSPKDGKISRLDVGVPYVSSFSVGKNENRYLSVTGGDFSCTGKGELLDMKTGKLTLIDNPYGKEYADTEVGESSGWSFKASDGTVIDCQQILPPDFDPNKKYPMIVYYYGGCSPTQKSVSVYDPHHFASRGYVALVINPSGAYGYGQEFSSRHANAWGKRTAEDIIEGVKEYCATHDFVNDKKIGCIGASYGGFMTQYLQTLTDIFAAAVSHAGISNVTSYWGEGNWGYSYNVVAAPESYPWNNPELYTRQGSLFNADKITTPLLLLHGNVDTNVPLGESIQLFNALRILGRDVEFVQVDGENHYIADYDKRKLWHNTIMAWFAKYLQDSPEWWDSLYKK